MDDETLTPDEVSEVLRRAAELDTTVTGRSRTGDGLTPAAIEAAATDAGLSPVAVRQAIAEMRAGALGVDEGPGTVVTRRIEAPAEEVHDTIARALRRQAMTKVRERGTTQVWRRRRDLGASLTRALDFNGRVRLGSVERLTVAVVSESDERSVVHLAVEMVSGVSHAPVIGGAAGSAVGAVGLGAAGMALGDGALAATALGAVPGAVGVGTLGWFAGRWNRAARTDQLVEALEGLCDRAEQGDKRGARAIDALKHHLRGS